MAFEETVVVRLTGRLGNHIFQFAAGYQLAQNKNASLVFDSQAIPEADLLLPKVIGDLYQDAPRRLLWRFGRSRETQGGGPTRARRLVIRAGNSLMAAKYIMAHQIGCKRHVYKEKSDQWFTYDASVNALVTPCYVEGFFQHNRYFSSVERDIAIHISGQLQDFSERLRELSHGRRILGISFRRGDYNVYGAVLRLDWYELALQRLPADSSEYAVVVFGDDPDFVFLMAERLARAGYRVLDVSGLCKDPVDQLSIMAECDDLIIANSSFAWWGAFLGDWKHGNNPRRVVAPEHWIGGESYRLIREGWESV